MKEVDLLLQVGEPLSPAEEAHEAAASREVEVSEEMARLAAYFGGDLSREDEAAVRHRLNTDAAYLEWAAPLLGVRAVRPAAVTEVPHDVVDRLLARGGRPRPTAPALAGRPLFVRWLRDLAIVGLAVVVLVGSAVYIGAGVLERSSKAIAHDRRYNDP